MPKEESDRQRRVQQDDLSRRALAEPIDSLSGFLPKDLQYIRTFEWADEFECAVDLIVGTAIKRKIPLSPQTMAMIRKLAPTIGLTRLERLDEIRISEVASVDHETPGTHPSPG